jgi:hypothetical protein
MSGTQEPDLQAEVRRLVRADEPPDAVRGDALNAYARRERDSEVLALVSDSLVDSDDDLIDATRLLVFAGAGTSVELTITARDERRQLIAKIEGPPVVTARIRTPTGNIRLSSDLSKGYVGEDVPRGPVTLLVEVEGERSRRHTEWVVI